MSTSTTPVRTDPFIEPLPDLSRLTADQLVELMQLAGIEIGRRYATPTPRAASASTGARRCRYSPAAGGRGPLAPPDKRHRLTMAGFGEDQPGPKWQQLFAETWPAYRAWFASEGLDRRPDLATSSAALRTHMPELVPTWEQMVDLARETTGGDEVADRMLTLWSPPAFAPACSQLAVDRGARLLVRNYDYDPQLFEGLVWSSLLGTRRVIGTGDCLWGLLDGMNDDGLVVSLTYGGRPGSGDGFAIPLVVRYLLETCSDVEDALAALARVPVAMSYNLTMADRSGRTVTSFVAPGSAPDSSDTPLATNHRGLVPEYPARARAIRSVERQDALRHLHREQSVSNDEVVAAFLRPPLHNTAFSRGFGTLYTAAYRPDDGVVEYVWPDRRWERRFDSPDDAVDVVLREPLAA